MLNAFTAVGVLRALTDFTLSNARRFYSSTGNPSAAKGLTNRRFLLDFCHEDSGILLFVCLFAFFRFIDAVRRFRGVNNQS